MADRPWVAPDAIKEYTDYPEVKSRDESKLKLDITKAEAYVIKYTKRNFDGVDNDGKKEMVPEDVKAAVILLAEMYAYNTVIRKDRMKSETFDDYSYSMDTSAIDIDALGIEGLLDPYVCDTASGNVVFRMRRL